MGGRGLVDTPDAGVAGTGRHTRRRGEHGQAPTVAMLSKSNTHAWSWKGPCWVIAEPLWHAAAIAEQMVCRNCQFAAKERVSREAEQRHRVSMNWLIRFS